jgi:hypothetical protein
MTGKKSASFDIIEAERHGVNQALAFVGKFEKPCLLDKDAHVFGLPKLPEDETVIKPIPSI